MIRFLSYAGHFVPATYFASLLTSFSLSALGMVSLPWGPVDWVVGPAKAVVSFHVLVVFGAALVGGLAVYSESDSLRSTTTGAAFGWGVFSGLILSYFEPLASYSPLAAKLLRLTYALSLGAFLGLWYYLLAAIQKSR